MFVEELCGVIEALDGLWLPVFVRRGQGHPCTEAGAAPQGDLTLLHLSFVFLFCLRI